MNLLASFCEELAEYLSGSKHHKLIRFYESGEFDFSFILSLEIWNKFICDLRDGGSDKYRDNVLIYATGEPDESRAIEQLKEKSKNWTFSIEDVSIKDGRCSFTISRPDAFMKLLTDVVNNPSYGKCDKVEDETISIEAIGTEDPAISSYRLQVALQALRNLAAYSKFMVVNDSSLAKHKILVTSKSNFAASHQMPHKSLLCGVVTDPLTKKTSQTTAQDYLKTRCQDMHLVSIHKYGVRVRDDESFLELVEKLGRAAATLDMMEVKQSSTLSLHANPQQAFILYNSARMETLMAKFDKKVTEGYYEKLPELGSIDTNLLQADEEWELLKMIIAFPDVINRSIGELSLGKASLHLIYKYLASLVSIFSVYYRRVRLLTESRPQLMPVLYAKIHFLRCLRRIMNETLAIFGIEPIAFM